MADPRLENMTAERWQKEKEQERLRDRERIARGEATPEEVQRENTFISLEEADWEWDLVGYLQRIDRLEEQPSDG